VATAPCQYGELMQSMATNQGCTTLSLRRKFAGRAFAMSAAYDSAIASWWSTNQDAPLEMSATTTTTASSTSPAPLAAAAAAAAGTVGAALSPLVVRV
jgi:phosphoribosylaminoimidazolecarboxamide formyltransferase/IMP cyclohydrolase